MFTVLYRSGEREPSQPIDQGDADGGLDEGEMDHRLPQHDRLGVRGARLADVAHLDERPQQVDRRNVDDPNAPISTSGLAHPSTRDPIPNWAEAGAVDVAISATAARAVSATSARLGRRVARMLMGLASTVG